MQTRCFQENDLTNKIFEYCVLNVFHKKSVLGFIFEKTKEENNYRSTWKIGHTTKIDGKGVIIIRFTNTDKKCFAVYGFC